MSESLAHRLTGAVGKAAVAVEQWPRALRAQDAVPRWHHTRHIRAAGLHRPACRLGAQIPVNLTRFHGVFAPNSAHRAQVTPAKSGNSKRASMNGCFGALVLRTRGDPLNSQHIAGIECGTATRGVSPVE